MKEKYCLKIVMSSNYSTILVPFFIYFYGNRQSCPGMSNNLKKFCWNYTSKSKIIMNLLNCCLRKSSMGTMDLQLIMLIACPSNAEACRLNPISHLLDTCAWMVENLQRHMCITGLIYAHKIHVSVCTMDLILFFHQPRCVLCVAYMTNGLLYLG